MLSLFCLYAMVAAGTVPSASWSFDAGIEGWTPNEQFAEVQVVDGVLQAHATGWDPSFSIRDLEIAASPWQGVRLRMRADQPGRGELFWSGTLEGEYGGLSQVKSTPFQVTGDGAWHNVHIYPFWHTEGTIRQLRLDLYEGARFMIDEIVVEPWQGDLEPVEPVFAWEAETLEAWKRLSGTSDRLSPVLALPVEGMDWVSVRLQAQEAGSGAVLWVGATRAGLQSAAFEIQGDGRDHTYHIEVAEEPGWRDHILALGLRLPSASEVIPLKVQLGAMPEGPPELQLRYLGFEDGVPRAGRPLTVIAQFQNVGGDPASVSGIRLTLPGGVGLVENPEQDSFAGLGFGEELTRRWTVLAAAPGAFPIGLEYEVGQEKARTTSVLGVLPALTLATAQYVPAPVSVKTGIDVCMYYFPGWANRAAWDPVQRVAPWRKPVLGWYDEGNPEVVDWQIKWAVENGIGCFLVDWYWVAGSQHLTHWFDAYRKARYRDQLEVAIMWANHNPPNTHSREDWRQVTRHWLEQYFTLPSYYATAGCPAVFLWDPDNIRRDLGSSEEVRAAFEQSRQMARDAGFPGITFVALHGHESPARAAQLLAEGYDGMTDYHEWGKADSLSQNPKHLRFVDVATTSREVWREKEARSGALAYFPVADTGWDARPWHGQKSLVIEGRSAALFADLLRELKQFAEETGKTSVVLSPANEWGEGSYIEPCTEFGFSMYEAVRQTFAVTSPESWPVNVTPRDVGLGPYDFPEVPVRLAWTFDTGADGWAGMMGVTTPELRDGALDFRTTTRDPALRAVTPGVAASRHPEFRLRMRLQADAPEAAHAQLFWTVGPGATSEAASVDFPVVADGEYHVYRVNLAENPRWRGNITSLRLDPCSLAGVNVSIDEVRID